MMSTRWADLMAALDLKANQATFERLQRNYGQSHRHYHDLKHIQATLLHLDEVWGLAREPELIALALWFHDAIYQPFSSTNEANSAQWAVDFMRANHMDQAAIDGVHALIMITAHDAQATGVDQQLMIDIDLGILGSPPDVYQQYEVHIRKEYRWVPRFIYNKKRLQLLRSFAAREQLYNHPHFQQLWTVQARTNLQWAIEQLAG